MRVPWTDLLRAAPVALRAADRLLRAEHAPRRDPAPMPSTLPERVERLETALASHAEVSRDLAAQASDLARALRVLAFRTMLAIVLAAAALGVAVVALVRTL
jgi:hypothetical protein